MKNPYAKVLPVLALSLFIIPQVAFAAWWNPFTWSIWSIFEQYPKAQIQTALPSTPQIVRANFTLMASSSTSTVATTPVVNKKRDNLSRGLPLQQSQGQISPATIPFGATPIVPTQPVAHAQTQSAVISSNQLENALARYQAQVALDFMKTAAPHLASIAGLEQARLNINIQGRQSCEQTYNQAQDSGFNVNPSGIAAFEQYQQQKSQQLTQDKNDCLAQYPIGDASLPQQIDQAVNRLNNLWQQVLTNPTSPADVASILQQYNSLESQIYAFNSQIMSPISLPATNQSPKVGNFSCSGMGNGYSCVGANMNTDCSIHGNSVDCIGKGIGENVSCSLSGGYLNCSSY